MGAVPPMGAAAPMGAAPIGVAPGAPPVAGGWDGAASQVVESPWATTSARLEMPVLPSTFAPERPEPQKPAASAPPPREGTSRTIVLALSVILAIAVLALVGLSVWQRMGGDEPIKIGYTEPTPTSAEAAPPPTASETAAPSTTAAPRAVPRARPKGDDIYDEVEKEKSRR